MADPVAASGAASPFRAGTVLRPPRPSLLDAVAHSAVLRALAAWRDNGGGQPPLLLDGTAGNGHDCLFLARQVPAGSLLLALDIQKAALQADSDKASLRKAELDMTEQVQTAFLEYLKAGENTRSMRDSLTRLREQLRIAQAYFEVGLSPRLDVLQAEVDVSEAESLLI